MFRPINWKTFPRDFIVIQIGFSLFAFGIALLIRADIGSTPWVMLTVALSRITGLSIGVLTQLTGLGVLAIALAMRIQIGWGTLGNILFIGPWVDLFLRYMPTVENNLPLQIGMVLLSVVLTGLATAVYIGVQAGAGPRDSLMLAVAKLPRMSIQIARNGIELFVLVISWILGEPPGIGTLIFALTIGPSVQWWFKRLDVERPSPPQTKPESN